MNTKGTIHAHKKAEGGSEVFPQHEESLPNASTILSVSVLADRDEVVAAVLTATLLARSFAASLSVDVLDERVLYLGPGGRVMHGSVESSLTSVRTKLVVPRIARFALEASITSASFLTAGSISLQVHAVESCPQEPFNTR